jgi:hypothetical protein
MIGLLSLALAAAALSPAESRFEQVKTLAGEWEGKREGGRTIRISLRPISRGSALVETWTLAPGRETMTVYHMDGAQLIATHYCAMGNQPRLVMADGTGPRLSFSFRDATNLPSPTAAHQHSFWIEPQGPNQLTKSETYIDEGVEETETIVFNRVKAAD